MSIQVNTCTNSNMNLKIGARSVPKLAIEFQFLVDCDSSITVLPSSIPYHWNGTES